jgi:hypothetical protein
MVGSAGMALAVAETEPAAAELSEEVASELPALDAPEAEMPPVGTEPAPRVMPRSLEEPRPVVERKSLPEPDAVTEPMETTPAGSVARSSFTTEVLDREPQGEVSALENDATEIAYFTELRGLDGHQVTHRWEFNGEKMAEVAFEVRGERWRVHSRKKLDPAWLGTWSVVVLDSTGTELSRETFDYVEAASVPANAAEAPEAPTAMVP